MTKVNDLHRKWMKNKQYRKAYEELAPEFRLARAVIDARVTAGLTQEQLAERMDTTQSVVARLESGRTRPSTQTLERLAAATGTRLRISFEAEGGRRTAG
jgi:transcriptional regulator with XRE-family HTH domain